jgi:NDP-mannose synthase
MQAIILAGGRGRRLHPYTTVLPKPLMPIGDYPILEIVLRQLEKAGFSDIIISTGYLDALIRAYIESRDIHTSTIRFSHENSPLGTIGPLHLIPDLDDTFLVINGDILTDLNYGDFMSYHSSFVSSGNLTTIATYSRKVNTDFGILEYNSENIVTSFKEKPILSYEVSMGIYIFQREILNYVPKEEVFGFDNLMNIILTQDLQARSYPFKGYWLDIGRPDDYAQAIDQLEKDPDRFLS